MIKFGTDGWRAVIAQDFTFENVKIVSQAIADYIKKKSKDEKRVIVGYDRRFLSREFAETVSLVLAANKVKVVLSDGDVPTPAVSFHCLRGKHDLGVMVTASHNSAKFNGLKIKTSEGGSADKFLTDEVEGFLYKNKPKWIETKTARMKGFLEVKDLNIAYVEFLKKFVDLKKIRKLKLKILIDTMYGVGDSFVEKVLGHSRIKIDYLHKEFNPSFGGIHPEPVADNLKELIEKIKKEKYDLGLALDGDADRVTIIDSKGNYISAQVILPLLAVHMIKNRKIKGGIGKTVVGSNIIDKVAISLGAACYETPIGFKYLSKLFKDNLICIGGEEAGGIGFKGYIPERDGSASFLILLEMLAWDNESFDSLLSAFYKQYGRYYYNRTSIPLKNIRKSLSDLKIPDCLCGKKIERINTLDGIKLITKDSWLMFRKSGTEPIVRVYAESKSKKEKEKLIALGKELVYVL